MYGEPANSIDLANKILEIAAHHNWLRFQIEGRLLLGLAYHLSGNPTRARQETLQALELAEPEGYVRLFVDKGAPMQALLEEVRREVEKQAHDPAPMLAYIDRLLEVFSPASSKQPAPVNSQTSRNLAGV